MVNIFSTKFLWICTIDFNPSTFNLLFNEDNSLFTTKNSKKTPKHYIYIIYTMFCLSSPKHIFL